MPLKTRTDYREEVATNARYVRAYLNAIIKEFNGKHVSPDYIAEKVDKAIHELGAIKIRALQFHEIDRKHGYNTKKRW